MADCTIIDKLNYILETKDLIKTALETQDIEVLESDTFRKYSEYITEIRKVASVNGETGDIVLKTINGQNLVGEGDIVIQGGEGGTAGVNKIILGDEDYGWNSYQGDVKLTNGWQDLDDDSVPETYDIRIGDNSGSSLWFGFNSKDNSIKIEDNGSRLSFTVNPDILGGGGGSVTETDPVFTEWKNNETIVAGNGATYDTDGASEEEIHPSIVIGKDASVWADGIAIGENVYSEMGAVTIGKNVTSYGIVSIGSDNEGSGIAIGKNNKGDGIIIGENNNSGSGVAIGKNITENYGGISIGDYTSNPTDSGIAIGFNAKVNTKYPNDTDNGYGIAIGNSAIAYGKNDVAIGKTVETDDAYTTNINNIIKGDSNKYAYIKDENGNYTKILDLINNGGGTAGVSAINVGRDVQDWTQKTGVVSFYTDWYDGSYDVAIGGTSFFGVKPIDNSIILENAGGTVNGNTRCGIKINTDNFKTINGESIIGEGNIKIEGGGSSSGVESIDTGGIYFKGKLSFSSTEESSDNSWRVGLNGDMYDSTTDEYYGNGGSLIFGVKSSDNSIIVRDGGSLADLTINPDILSGGSGSGSGTINIIELTQAEYDALTEYADNTFYVITDANKQYTTLEEVEQQGYLKAIPDTYVTDGELSTAISDKVSQTALNEAIQGVEAKIPTEYVKMFGEETANNLIYYTLQNNEYREIKFKTINNNTIIGDGNITIEGGGSVDTSKFVTYVGMMGDTRIAVMTDNDNLINEIYFPTINGKQILGVEGDVTISTDLTNYYTKSEIDNLIGGVSDKISDINSMI